MRPTTNHGAWRVAAVAALFLGVVACADKAFAPPSGGMSARLNIRASLAAQASSAAKTVRVIVASPTAGTPDSASLASGRVPGLVDTSVTVTGTSASLSLNVPISGCLSVPSLGGSNACELVVFIGLFDASEQIVSDTVFLLPVTPGVTPPAIDVTLRVTYTLTAVPIGTGLGTITANPPGFSYAPGTVVTLTATPVSGSVFSGWSGDCTGTAACVVTMSTNRAVTATFSANATFAGTFGGNLGNFATPSGACVSNAALSGSQTVTLVENTNGTVTGTATGTAVVTATGVSGVNCTQSGGTFPFTVAVSGTDAAMAWGTTGPPFNMQFSGHRTGNTITGSLATTSIFQVSDSTGAKADTLLVTIPNVTLTRTSAVSGLLIPAPGSSGAISAQNGGSAMVLRHR